MSFFLHGWLGANMTVRVSFCQLIADACLLYYSNIRRPIELISKHFLNHKPCLLAVELSKPFQQQAKQRLRYQDAHPRVLLQVINIMDETSYTGRKRGWFLCLVIRFSKHFETCALRPCREVKDLKVERRFTPSVNFDVIIKRIFAVSLLNILTY